MSLEDLAPKLKAITNANAEAQIFVRADRNVTYDRIAEVISTITSAGFKKIALVAEPLKQDEMAALHRQIENCWNIPIGGPNSQNQRVDVMIDVNPDRTVQNVNIVDKVRYANDPYYHVLADAAMRAVRNPKCSPLKLPADKYDTWKRIYLTFDPRDML